MPVPVLVGIGLSALADAALSYGIALWSEPDTPTEEDMSIASKTAMLGTIGAGAIVGGKKLYDSRIISSKGPDLRSSTTRWKEQGYIDLKLDNKNPEPRTNYSSPSPSTKPKSRSKFNFGKRNSIGVINLNKNASGSKKVLAKAKGIMGKWAKKGKWGAAISVGAMAIPYIANLFQGDGKLLEEDAPKVELAKTDQLKQIAISAAVRDDIEKKVGINYMSQVEENAGKIILEMLKKKDISNEGVNTFIDKFEGDLHDAWANSVSTLRLSFIQQGGNNYAEAKKNYIQMKGLGRQINSYTRVIKSNASKQEKDQARQEIMQLKRGLYEETKRDEELRETLKVADNYLAYNYNQLKVASNAAKSKKGAKVPPAATLNLLRDLITVTADDDDDAALEELESLKNYIQSTIPESGKLGGSKVAIDWGKVLSTMK